MDGTPSARMLLATGVLGAALALSACSSSGKGGGGAATGGTTSSAAAAPTAAPTAGTSATAPGAAAGASASTGTAPCAFSQLAVTQAQQGNAGMGHIGAWILFRNTGGHPCMLYGYPGAAALDAAGRQVAQAQRTLSGYLGGVQSGGAPPHVTISPGAAASAVVEGSDVPSGSATGCTDYAALLITPPNTRHSVVIKAQLPSCQGLQVHPVVPGSSGTLP